MSMPIYYSNVMFFAAILALCLSAQKAQPEIVASVGSEAVQELKLQQREAAKSVKLNSFGLTIIEGAYAVTKDATVVGNVLGDSTLDFTVSKLLEVKKARFARMTDSRLMAAGLKLSNTSAKDALSHIAASPASERHTAASSFFSGISLEGLNADGVALVNDLRNRVSEQLLTTAMAEGVEREKRIELLDTALANLTHQSAAADLNLATRIAANSALLERTTSTLNARLETIRSKTDTIAQKQNSLIQEMSANDEKLDSTVRALHELENSFQNKLIDESMFREEVLSILDVQKEDVKGLSKHLNSVDGRVTTVESYLLGKASSLERVQLLRNPNFMPSVLGNSDDPRRQAALTDAILKYTEQQTAAEWHDIRQEVVASSKLAQQSLQLLGTLGLIDPNDKDTVLAMQGLECVANIAVATSGEPAAILAAANSVANLLSGPKPNPDVERHRQIMEALNRIENRLYNIERLSLQILRNQQQIFRNQQTILREVASLRNDADRHAYLIREELKILYRLVSQGLVLQQLDVLEPLFKFDELLVLNLDASLGRQVKHPNAHYGVDSDMWLLEIDSQVARQEKMELGKASRNLMGFAAGERFTHALASTDGAFFAKNILEDMRAATPILLAYLQQAGFVESDDNRFHPGYRISKAGLAFLSTPGLARTSSVRTMPHYGIEGLALSKGYNAPANRDLAAFIENWISPNILVFSAMRIEDACLVYLTSLDNSAWEWASKEQILSGSVAVPSDYPLRKHQVSQVMKRTRDLYDICIAQQAVHSGYGISNLIGDDLLYIARDAASNKPRLKASSILRSTPLGTIKVGDVLRILNQNDILRHNVLAYLVSRNGLDSSLFAKEYKGETIFVPLTDMSADTSYLPNSLQSLLRFDGGLHGILFDIPELEKPVFLQVSTVLETDFVWIPTLTDLLTWRQVHSRLLTQLN